MKYVWLFILAFALSAQTYAQMELGAETSIQSPNAASLGKFGDIPVSLFTGSAGITIPVTSIDHGPIKVPVRLEYDAGGCRIDQHPSWVGLNWTLQAGGVIKRQCNGMFDEFKYNDVLKGYLDPECHSSMGAANWNTQEFLTAPSNFMDRYPDEFIFNFNGITGSFMLNHEGKWIVRSKENLRLKVTHEVQQEYSVPGIFLPLPRVITKFTVITNDGTTYVFGGDLNAIEISSSSMPTIIPHWLNPPVPPVASNTGYQRYIQTSAWHLSEIIAPSGHRVKFNYARGYNLTQLRYSEVSHTYPFGSPPGGVYRYDINLTNKYGVFVSYLESITADDIVCTFSRSVSNELPQQMQRKPVTQDHFNFDFSVITGSFLQYFKLDAIELKVNNTPVKKYAFTYIEKPTERLKLREVKSLSPTGNQVEFNYGIEYNSRLLPAYCSGNDDHWGFYNGKNFSGGSTESNIQVYPDINNYYQTREPDTALVSAEIIRKLIYPTGGYSEFYFEPHDYAALVKQDPAISLQTLSEKKIAGGLRIKMIKTYDGLTATPNIKEYFYVKDYNTGGTASSGILAGEPKYYEEYQMANFSEPYKKFSSMPLNTLNTTNGSHITYTQVTEKNGDGYTTYTYSNHDNGYIDKPAFAQIFYSPTTSYVKKLYGKLDLERGLLLSRKMYAADNVLEKEIADQYNQDPSRYNQLVRAMHNFVFETGGTGNVVTFPIYTFYPYRTKELTTTYVRGGSPVRSEVSYTYDPTHQMLRTSTTANSDGIVKRITYKYPPDYPAMPSAPATNEVHDISALTAGNIVGTPVEVIQSVVKGSNEFITGGKMTWYEDLKPEKLFELEAPDPIPAANFAGTAITANGFTADSRYKEKVSYSGFDSRANVREVTGVYDVTTSYLWGYNRAYPVAKIVNAKLGDISAVIGTTGIDNLALSYNDADIRSAVDQLRVGLPKAQVYTYTFKPLIGITSQTDPNNITTTFEYDNFGRLYLSRDNAGRILKRYDYSYMQLKRVSLSHSSLNFGGVTMGQSASQTITVNNIGMLPVTISSLTVPAGYSYTINGAATIAPNESLSVTIKFSPTAVTTYAGNITIASDGQGPNTIAVTGTGVGTKIISITGDLAFGATTGSGMSFPCRSRNMVISNTGTLPLTVTNVTVPHPFRTNWTSGVIQPGASQTAVISFCPVVTGSFSGTITVASDKTSGTETISVSGSARR